MMRGQDLIDKNIGTKTVIGGFIDAARDLGIELAPTIHSFAMPSGAVVREEFEAQMADTLDDLEAAMAAGPIDGVLLGLHGAMVIEGIDDGEGEYLRRVREMVGPDVPIVTELDLHANISQESTEIADIMIGYDTYPHIDMYERAWQGADLLERTMRGEIKPKTILARAPLIFGLNQGRTQDGPMAELLKRADAHEAAGDALVVSVCAGFTRADIHDVGPSVTVTGDGDDPRLQKIAESFMDYAWETRNVSSIKLMSIAEVVGIARAGKPGDKPLVISDYTDNPGGGGYGDATALLKAMVEAGLPDVAFHALYDPAAVQGALKHGLGRTTLTIGGKTDPTLGGGPLTLEGEITTISSGKFIAWGPMGGGVARDHGPSVVFRVGGIDIVLITNSGQTNDLGQFTSLGIDPTRYTTVCVKSMQHFRAAFEPIAGSIHNVDAAGIHTHVFKNLRYQKRTRAVFPVQIPADQKKGVGCRE